MNQSAVCTSTVPVILKAILNLLFIYIYIYILHINIYYILNYIYINTKIFYYFTYWRHDSVIRQSSGYLYIKFKTCYLWKVKVKVKVTLVQALRLCTGRTAHRGSRRIVLPFHDHGTRRGWGVSVTPQPLFTPRKDSVPIVQEAVWPPEPVWIGAKSLAPYRDSITGPSSRPVQLSGPQVTCSAH